MVPSAAKRMTMAMTSVADREIPHWQLWGGGGGEKLEGGCLVTACYTRE